jgi:histidinol-phosphate aminotransferase
MKLNKLLRPNIRKMTPYSSARDEYSREAMVFLDANENPFNTPYNRYPDPYQQKLKKRIAALKQIAPEKIFLGNGSDEPIDLLFRAFCEPRRDNVVMMTPSYGMYHVAAEIHDIHAKKILLDKRYQLQSEKLLAEINKHTKLIFLCSPNNPTANILDKKEIVKVIQNFQGCVILDEAYIDFLPQTSLLPELEKYPNLVILQTFSKAWGMAGIRLGMAFAQEELIAVLNKIKYPYNINMLTQQKALELLAEEEQKNQWVEVLIKEKNRVTAALKNLPFVVEIFPSDANFLLVRMKGARRIYDYLMKQGVIVRDRSKEDLCQECLRITVGSKEENDVLLHALTKFVA